MKHAGNEMMNERFKRIWRSMEYAGVARETGAKKITRLS
jgi:hypothetical protein